jgi:predicted AlkP superfamily pyrophosphatase or phosphodiesterase
LLWRFGCLPILLLVACGSPPHRVVLISLDGAGADTLRQLHRQGALRAGGFERFFREGQVAEALIPVNPTLTSVNHISLATGFAPSATGIVGNQFYPQGGLAPLANGFAAPIGTDTLWEAARRQGLHVGVLAWPGADAKGERRTADWGLVFNAAADYNPQILALSRADWQPAPGPGREGTASDPAPPTTQVEVASETAKTGEAGTGGNAAKLTLSLRLVAVRSRGDKAGYDGLTVADEPAGKVGGGGGDARAPMHAGEWRQVSWAQPGGTASAWLKLVSLAPDLGDARLYLGPVFHTIAYPGRFAQLLRQHGLDWPGPPDSADLAATWQGKPGIDLDTWTAQADHMAAFMGGALRSAAAGTSWDLLLCYIPVLDDAGHRLLLLDPRQPDFSPGRRDDLARARLRVWEAVDRELRELLAGLDLTRTTVVVVSDHGMAPIHTVIDPIAPLSELGLLANGGADSGATRVAHATADGGVSHVYLDAGAEAGARARTLAALARRYADWRVAGEAPIERIFSRREAARLGLDHPNSGDLILFAREGYGFRSLPGGKAVSPAPIYGAHGYLATHSDMRAIYLAIGAGVEPGTSGVVQATEVAPRVARWLGIASPSREIRLPRLPRLPKTAGKAR